MLKLVETSSGQTLVGNDPTLQSEAVADDSDKTFTVPAGKQWTIKSIYALLVSTATVGNRILTVLFTKADNTTVLEIRAGVAQAASLTYRYGLFPGAAFNTTVANNFSLTPIPPDFVLPAGYKVRIYDSAAIAAAADDLTLQMLVDESQLVA